MKTLLDFDKGILKDYNLWENANKGKWSVGSYINEFYDLNAALSISKLYFPDFVEVQGCIILGFRYDAEIFNQWYDKFQGEITPTERYCNLYGVADYLHINKVDYDSDETYREAIEIFSRSLKISWEINCKLLFPNRQMKIEELEEYGVKRITLYTDEYC
jgi:hypothetical protein